MACGCLLLGVSAIIMFLAFLYHAVPGPLPWCLVPIAGLGTALSAAAILVYKWETGRRWDQARISRGGGW